MIFVIVFVMAKKERAGLFVSQTVNGTLVISVLTILFFKIYFTKLPRRKKYKIQERDSLYFSGL